MSKFNIDYGNDYEYAQSRLRDTLVMHNNGYPLLVRIVDCETGEVQARKIGHENSFYDSPWEYYSLSDINLKPVKLGYGNKGIRAGFMYRMPVRHYKQGLNNVNFRSTLSSIPFHHRAVANAIMNKYPKAINCLESIMCGEAISRAFSRDFAFINSDHMKADLLFRNKKVGVGKPSPDGSNINFTLNEKDKFLQEMFEEAINV